MESGSASLAAVGELLLQSQKHMFRATGPSVDQVLGVTASLGLSLSVVRWLLTPRGSLVATEGEEDGENKRQVAAARSGILFAVMGFFRYSLRRALLDSNELQQYESGAITNEVSDGTHITHQGSCHCKSVTFEIKASRTLLARAGEGKIGYRHTEIKSSGLRFVRGQGHLKTYYVVVDDVEDRGAHVFCGRCGCQILFAPSRKSNRLFINVNLLDEGIQKIRVVKEKCAITASVPLEGQWDDAQLTTIGNVAQQDVHPYFHPVPSMRQYDSLSTDGSSGRWDLYDQVANLEQHKYDDAPPTPATLDSFGPAASDVQSLPPLRIQPRLGSDADTILTESDSISVAQSEYAMSVGGNLRSLGSPRSRPPLPNPDKPLPQLYDQMKQHMKKHVSPSSKQTKSRIR